VPVGEELFTSMKPLDVKIWILGWSALHTSRVRALTTNVPSRPFPSPANRLSRRPAGAGDAWGAVAAPFDVDVACPAAELPPEAAAAPVADVVELPPGAVAL